jgi:hypothetical protein
MVLVVSLQIGQTKMEVRGEEKEVASTLEKFFRDAQTKPEILNGINALEKASDIPRTASDKVNLLIGSGFFGDGTETKHRKLNDIRNELARIGFNMSASTLSPTLLRDFVAVGRLQRVPVNGDYQYFLPLTVRK